VAEPRSYRGRVKRIDGRLTEVEVLWESVPDRSIYPYSIPSIGALDRLGLDQPVTFLVGENGSGKSTLLEALAVASGMNPEGGSRNLSFSTRDTHSDLHEHLRLTWRGRPKRAFFLRAESFYNVASEYEELAIPGMDDLHDRSHGESFLEAVLRLFRPAGLYLLDEPESALSLRGQLALLRTVHERLRDSCQFVISTHSPILLAFPDATILQMSEDGPIQIEYQDTDQYLLTRAFLDDPETFFRHLFSDEE
jgi:predicted ATPase